MTDPPDIIVIGGGPGGYATALRAAGHGLTVLAVEADKVGGTCLHRGCIPSKALLHIGHLADAMPELIDLGLATPGSGLDLTAAARIRDRTVATLHTGLTGLLTARKIDVVAGHGRVTGPGEVAVTHPDGTTSTRQARHVVIATGSSPVDLPAIEPDGTRILRSDDALRLERIPTSALVVGGGAIGVELASLWRSFGAEVTIIEAADRLLPLEDPAISTALARAFSRRGIRLRTGTALAGMEHADDGVTVTVTDGDTFDVDQALIAVGRRPNTAGNGLAEAGVLDDRGYVAADPWGRTAIDGLWAVGDVLPTLALAHAAFAEGFIVADAIAGLEPDPVAHHLIPRVTYCSPEVASVGWTEAEARARFGDDVISTTQTMAGNAKALIDGSGIGIVKLVVGPDGTLLGAHIVGPSATELIAELGLATSWEALAAEVGQVAHAHPSLAEAIRETALVAAGTPFHAHS